MPCDVIAAESVAERYLLGQLSEEEQVAFERHYFDCERCFGELQTLEAMRADLRGSAAPAIQLSARRGWWPAWVGAAAAVVLAAGMGFWLMRPGQEGRPSPPDSAAGPVAVSPPPVDAAPTPPPVQTPAVSVAELARFEPPPYTPVVLRGPEDEARRIFLAAMEHYRRGEYRQAIDGLRGAAGKDPGAAEVAFFLGVSLLLTGQQQGGVAELQRTVALGDSPYLEEAYFYLAKGLLQKGDVSGARRALRAMIALGGDHQREAKQLLSQVERAVSGRQ